MNSNGRNQSGTWCVKGCVTVISLLINTGVCVAQEATAVAPKQMDYRPLAAASPDAATAPAVQGNAATQIPPAGSAPVAGFVPPPPGPYRPMEAGPAMAAPSNPGGQAFNRNYRPRHANPALQRPCDDAQALGQYRALDTSNQPGNVASGNPHPAGGYARQNAMMRNYGAPIPQQAPQYNTQRYGYQPPVPNIQQGDPRRWPQHYQTIPGSMYWAPPQSPPDSQAEQVQQAEANARSTPPPAAMHNEMRGAHRMIPPQSYGPAYGYQSHPNYAPPPGYYPTHQQAQPSGNQSSVWGPTSAPGQVPPASEGVAAQSDP